MTAFNIETLCQHFATEFQDWLNLPDRNRANETLQSVARIILHRVASRLDLAPRLTPKELEAKIDAVTREWDKYNTSFADVRSAIRREFSGVACGDGVDWKAKWEELHRQWQAKAASLEVAERERDEIKERLAALYKNQNVQIVENMASENLKLTRERDEWKAKYQSAKEELEESEHARHLQIEELASVHSEIEAAERERDALAASVRELEGKASTLDDMLGLIHALDDANTDDFARREGLHIAALLNHVRDNKKLKALIAELEARNGK